METQTDKIMGPGLQIPDSKKQTRWIKAVALGILAVISFGFTWKLLQIGLVHNPGLWFWFFPSLAAAFGISFLALLAIVDISLYLFWAVNFAILVLYILILPKDLAVYTGGLLFFLFVFLFEKYVRDDEHGRVDFSIHRILKHSINLMVYGLLIVLGFNLYQQIELRFQNNPDEVYGRIGQYAAEGLKYLPSGFGNFDPNQSFDQFVTQQAETQDPSIVQAPAPVRDQVVQDFRQQLVNKFHLNVSGDPLLGEVVAGAVAEKTKEGSRSYSRFFPAIFAILIVILLRYTAFLFVWLTSLVCWLIFKLLLWTKFFRIEKVKVEVDKLQI